MKTFILLLTQFLLLSKIYSQSDSIIYNIPIDVQNEIENEMDKNLEFYNLNENIPYLLWENEKDTIICSLYTIGKKPPKKEFATKKQILLLALNTNRFIKTNKYSIPIIFHDDFSYFMGKFVLSTYTYRIKFNRIGLIKENKGH